MAWAFATAGHLDAPLFVALMITVELRLGFSLRSTETATANVLAAADVSFDEAADGAWRASAPSSRAPSRMARNELLVR